MNTGGQMGVATGNAAALCKKYGTNPRGVYQKHMAELQSLIGLNQYFGTPDNTVSVIDNADSSGVEITGAWTSSTSNSGFYRSDYIHDGNTGKGAKSVRFRPDLPLAGNYRVYLRWTASGNRADNVPVDIHCADGTHTIIVNQQVDHGGWALLGTFPFELGSEGTIVIRTTGTTAYVIADAMAVAAAFDLNPGFDGVPWADDDGDGVCNYAEWLNGTDPLDPLSFVNVRVEGQNGAWVLRFVALAGKSYTVLYRDSLSDGSWQELEDVEALAVTREVAVADAESATRASRFYRLVTPKIP
jgi:hypothetical protein